MKRQAVRCQADADKICEQWAGLPKKAARAFIEYLGGQRSTLPGFDRDDAYDHALAAMMRAAQLWEEGRVSRHTGRPVRFSSYCWRFMWGYMSRAFDRAKLRAARERRCPGGAPYRAADPRKGPPEEAAGRELRQVLLAKLRVLTGNQRAVIVEYYLKGRSLREVGRRLGFTAEYARQARDAALLKLRKAFGGPCDGEGQQVAE